MLMNSLVFYESLPDRCCSKCGEKMEEMADCYQNVCDGCSEKTFYPLSPILLNLFNPTFATKQ